jgi:hypothetical protein
VIDGRLHWVGDLFASDMHDDLLSERFGWSGCRVERDLDTGRYDATRCTSVLSFDVHDIGYTHARTKQ